jgi:hypothetical protein
MARLLIALLMAVALYGADLSAEGLESKAPKLVVWFCIDKVNG